MAKRTIIVSDVRYFDETDEYIIAYNYTPFNIRTFVGFDKSTESIKLKNDVNERKFSWKRKL